MAKRFSKIPKEVSLSAKGKKSYVYRVSVYGPWDIHDIFISHLKYKDGNEYYAVVDLEYTTSFNQKTEKIDIVPQSIKTIASFKTKEEAIRFQRNWVQNNAEFYERIA